jgi:demethylmenaquinone methyltransferase/2-methoxy-6-polyprenyl-1,4-benzoquinol methylase
MDEGIPVRRWPRDRYTVVAPFYDVVSAEWPVYRSGRLAGIEALNLAHGDRVLDVGCGTGLSFSRLVREIGPTGQLVGVDASPDMLRVAARRVRRQGWSNVRLVDAEAQTLTRETDGISAADGFDAVLLTYSLSVMRDPTAAWAAVLPLVRPGGRVAVVDMQVPTARGPLAGAMARLACRLGGADIHAHPWRLLEAIGQDVVAAERRGGHIQIRSGRFGQY